MQTWPRQVKRRIREIWLHSRDIHPLLEAELLGYFMLDGDLASANARGKARAKPVDQRQLRLPLDRELYRAILRELPRPTLSQARTG
jgi:hypothetical protein